jgi:hypothetical protein
VTGLLRIPGTEPGERDASRAATAEHSQRLCEGGRNEAMRRGSFAAATGPVFWTTLSRGSDRRSPCPTEGLLYKGETRVCVREGRP